MRHHTLCTQEISVAHSAENLADEMGGYLKIGVFQKNSMEQQQIMPEI